MENLEAAGEIHRVRWVDVHRGVSGPTDLLPLGRTYELTVPESLR